MSGLAYYNEVEPFAAQWLRNLIAAGRIPRGDVDERSIVDVSPADLAGYRQCHFFAGIGGWAFAARLAGWPDDRELWTGSPPCQPFSVAGKGKAQADDRHLWPHLFRLASARRPSVLMGEQVAAAVGKDWLDGVFADLESVGYACGAVVVPACAVDAPHRRDRLWFVARAVSERRNQAGRAPACHRSEDRGRQGDRSGNAGAAGDCTGAVADAGGERCTRERLLLRPQEARRDTVGVSEAAGSCAGSQWSSASWSIGHDGKARRVEPGIPLLAHGLPNRVGRLRAYGNAIVPQVAAEVIGAFMDCRP